MTMSTTLSELRYAYETARKQRNPILDSTYRQFLTRHPRPVPHGFDDGSRGDVVEVAGGCRDTGIAELAGDDGDSDAFGAELCGVGWQTSASVSTSGGSRPRTRARDGVLPRSSGSIRE